MPKLNLFSKPLDIKNKVYAMKSVNKDTVDLTFYGDVVESQPFDWWTGKPKEGNFIILDEFLKDLERLNSYKNITIHMNSYGGDCIAGFVIHNKLREFSRDGKKTTCIVDGVAMSAASLIMSACDIVKVNPASLVMVHKCWNFLFGGYNADELSECADQLSSYDKAIASSYARKTGMSEAQILHLMADTTYMTGKEAVEKGFADELIEDAEPIQIAASADGSMLYVQGKELHLAPGMVAPDFIKTIDDSQNKPVTTAVKETAENNNLQPDVTGNTTEGGTVMTKDELRAQYPDLVAEVEADAKAENAQAIENAVNEERQRLSAIDQIAGLYPSDAVQEAKYGKTACSAQELSFRMAQDAAKKGNTFMQDLAKDSASSGAEDVATTSADPIPDMNDNAEMSEKDVKAFMAEVFKK